MAVWVVPSIAADLWKMSVGDVMRLVEQDRLTAKTERGFLFVDLQSRDAMMRPMTYVPFQRDLPIRDDENALPEPESLEISRSESEPVDGPGDGSLLVSLDDPAEWIAVRRETAQRRIPPARRLAA